MLKQKFDKLLMLEWVAESNNTALRAVIFDTDSDGSRSVHDIFEADSPDVLLKMVFQSAYIWDSIGLVVNQPIPIPDFKTAKGAINFVKKIILSANPKPTKETNNA